MEPWWSRLGSSLSHHPSTWEFCHTHFTKPLASSILSHFLEYTYIHTHINIYMYTETYTNIYTYASIYIYKSAYINKHIHISVHTDIYIPWSRRSSIIPYTASLCLTPCNYASQLINSIKLNCIHSFLIKAINLFN